MRPKLVRWLTPAEQAEHVEDQSLDPDHNRRGWVDVTATHPTAHLWSPMPYPGTSQLVCRRSPVSRCPNKPVAILWRAANFRSGPPRIVPWAYCSDHMFGRIVEDGRVLAAWLLDPMEFLDVPS